MKYEQRRLPLLLKLSVLNEFSRFIRELRIWPQLTQTSPLLSRKLLACNRLARKILRPRQLDAKQKI